MVKRLLLQLERSIGTIRSQDSYLQVVSSIFSRRLVQKSGIEEDVNAVSNFTGENKVAQSSAASKLAESENHASKLLVDSSENDGVGSRKWNIELQWISKALEPAMQLYNWASEAEKYNRRNPPSSSRSLAEIFSNLQRSKAGIQDWSFSDLTLGLYLVYLRQSSTQNAETVKGVQIFSDSLVEELIYNVELAKGAYKDNAAGLAKHSMLRETNVLKFVKDSSVMRPGYYVGIDVRNKLVILGIRGTHTVYDLITDLITSSDQKVALQGFSTHFGTAEAARWFLEHELETVKRCLQKHKGFKLRLVGHSLGGAAAALLAIILRRRSAEELGFDPNLVSAVGFGTPPCVSKEVAENCSSYVSTVVLQDDVIPRLSTASLARLRNDILQTDWRHVSERQDWKSIVEWVGNAKQVVSLAQDVARNLSDYANFVKISSDSSGIFKKRETADAEDNPKLLEVVAPEELFVPGTMYYLKREECSYSLWQREPGEHFQRIILSGNLISDHKCDSHYYALRDVIKGLPIS